METEEKPEEFCNDKGCFCNLAKSKYTRQAFFISTWPTRLKFTKMFD